MCNRKCNNAVLSTGSVFAALKETFDLQVLVKPPLRSNLVMMTTISVQKRQGRGSYFCGNPGLESINEALAPVSVNCS